MINKIPSFLQSSLNKNKSNFIKKNSGFTLIELLVAMIIATLVITPLLGFMINILDTDRKEQAKVNSEQEVQTALDYIAQDLQQAIYIYDAKGIKAIKNQLPYANDRDKTPVLVFWTRRFVEDAIDVNVNNSSVGANDSFVYSLVAYYSIETNNRNNKDKTWSDQFRIARFELKDGIRNLEQPFKKSKGNDPPEPNYIKKPDDGFALFRLSDPGVKGTLEQKMNQWEKGSKAYNLNSIATLVDYVDASQINNSNKNELSPIDCTTVFNLDNIPSSKKSDKKAALQVPSFSGTHRYSTNQKLNNGSFYACVDVDRVSAKIFLRGNAYARLNQEDNSFSQSRQSFFPTASIQINGKGLIRLSN